MLKKSHNWAFSGCKLDTFRSETNLLFLENVCVDSEGIISAGNDVLLITAQEHIVWLNSEGKSAFIHGDSRFHNHLRPNVILERSSSLSRTFSSRKEGYPKPLPGRTLYIMSPFDGYEFGHFFDTFQRLIYIDNPGSYDNVLISNPKRIGDFECHLKSFGLDKCNVVQPKKGEPLLCEHLTYIFPVGAICQYTPETFHYLRRTYFNYFQISPSRSSKDSDHIRVFLTRTAPQKRCVLNSEQLYPELVKRNVVIIDGSESFEYIVRTIASATYIAGVHGALLVHNLFASEDAKILELCPSNRVVTLFEIQYRPNKEYTFERIEGNEKFDVNVSLDRLLSFYELT